MDEHGHDAPFVAPAGAFTDEEYARFGAAGYTLLVDPPNQRRYLPTLAELIDRLAIVQMKAIYIDKQQFAQEIADIKHDINLLTVEKYGWWQAEFIHAVLMLALSNRVIWENEAKARAGSTEQDKMLKFTHSINGVRSAAKNVIARACGERTDPKIDCLAADLPEEYGNWNVFDVETAKDTSGTD